jgi:hypothetical protein
MFVQAMGRFDARIHSHVTDALDNNQFEGINNRNMSADG